MAKRLIWADSLKGWLMILVIIGHAIQIVLGAVCENDHVWNLIYSFHMPAFMAVSGWLMHRTFKNRGRYIKRCNRRAYQLLVPYLAWGIISFMLGGIYTFDNMLNLVLKPDSYFWFLWVLFWINVIFMFCQWIADKARIDEVYPLIFVCGFLMAIMVILEFRIFGFQFIAYYFLFYTLGYFIHRFEKMQYSNVYVIGFMSVIWAFLAWFWNMHELPSWMPVIPHVPSSLLQYTYRGFTAFIAIFILLGLAPKVLDGEGVANKWISQLGVISLGLYVVHLSFIGQIKDCIMALIPTLSNSYAIVLTFIVSFVSSYIIVNLLMMNKWTARILLGKL